MIKCTSCGNENNDTAKFCRHCGQPMKARASNPSSGEKVCPKCLKKVPASAKFCRFCGNQFAGDDVAITSPDSNVDINRNFITWHILPGQLAVKIDERDIEGYGNVKGLYIVPGTQAMFFVNGKFVASLESGRYLFKDLISSNPSGGGKKRNAVINFFRNIANHIKNGIAALFGHRQNERDSEGEKVFYSVVLIKGTDFPLIFDLDGVTTANIRSEVGLHLICKLTDLNAFYNDQLADRKFASLETFANHVNPIVRTVLNQSLSSVSPQQVNDNEALNQKVLADLGVKFEAVYPYVSPVRIISLTATQAELENIRNLKEELYIAEQELEQAQLRDDFLNKMQNMEYSNQLRAARSKVEFEGLMDRIDEEGLLNEDKKAQFATMLAAQRLLREAKTDTETANALDQLKQSRMLSEEEIATLQRNIAHRAQMAELDDAQALAMATMQNAEALDKEALNWEIEIGNKRLENELHRQRMQDAYSDERRNADLDFQNRQMESKMDLLRQAQAIREEREQAEHQRDLDRRNADLERYKVTATMTFEQIMASNPDISPAAAAALAKKFEAEAEAARNDRTAELARQHDEDLRNILAQQMSLTRDIVNAQSADKQREIDRIHAESEHHQDRMLSGVQTTLNAVSQATRPVENAVFCPNCGRKNHGNAKVCENCGESLQ